MTLPAEHGAAEESDAPEGDGGDDAATTTRPERAERAYEGRKEIADALGCSAKTVQRLATRDYDPLPLRYDFLEREYIYENALKSWVNRQDLPAHAYHELHRLGRLPQQIRRAGGTTAKGATTTPRSPVQRAASGKVARRLRSRRDAA